MQQNLALVAVSEVHCICNGLFFQPIASINDLVPCFHKGFHQLGNLRALTKALTMALTYCKCFTHNNQIIIVVTNTNNCAAWAKLGKHLTVSAKPLLLSAIIPTPQHRKDDVSFWNYPHPEMRVQSREIYNEESINSLEILPEHPQMQDESINTIQETPNSQFRLVLSVTPFMPRTSSLDSVNDSTSLLLFSSTSSLTFVPTPKDQLPPSPTSWLLPLE